MMNVAPYGQIGKRYKMKWIERAACRGLDTAIFFPDLTKGQGVKKARTICQVCPVIEECREYGINLVKEIPMLSGMWGGWSSNQILEEAKRRAGLS